MSRELWAANCGLWAVGYELREVSCGLREVSCQVWPFKCELSKFHGKVPRQQSYRQSSALIHNTWRQPSALSRRCTWRWSPNARCELQCLSHVLWLLLCFSPKTSKFLASPPASFQSPHLTEGLTETHAMKIWLLYNNYDYRLLFSITIIVHSLHLMIMWHHYNHCKQWHFIVVCRGFFLFCDRCSCSNLSLLNPPRSKAANYQKFVN